MKCVLQITTWWNSCPDAEHFYGTVRDDGREFILDVRRCASKEEVIQRARTSLRQRFPRHRISLVVAPYVRHM